MESILKTNQDEKFDVVVIGAGAAGYAAAIAAHQSGAKVLVIEKCTSDTAGGNTRVSGGGWFVNLDKVKAATYLRSLCAEYTLSEDVIEAWATETKRNSDWLRSLGAKVVTSKDYHTTPEYPELEGSDCYGGMDLIDDELGNFSLYNFLHSTVIKLGISVRFSTAALALVQEPETGRVTAVEVEQNGQKHTLMARGGVVLASGGFEANEDMVRNYLGLADTVLWGSQANTGDGHRMAQKIGADLWNMQSMLTITGIKGDGKAGYYLALPTPQGPNSYLYVAPDARRFADESAWPRHGHVVHHGRYERFPLHSMHMIFDEKMRRAGPLSPPSDILPIGWQALMTGYNWSKDNSAEIEKGWILQADSIAELAALLSLNSDRLKETIQQYNEACSAGRDTQFGRLPNTLDPITEPPYYAIVSPPLLGWTNGGPRRDGRGRVLDPYKNPIQGLYAAGSVSSTYSWGKDGGFHIADALAFGRIAGKEAASSI
ncbi:FAD-dependent oxidoreductase [Parahaliea sp. F7430]|uniref:FAD-dependent oxidoreductase n=1 Tax=Sediminihaliea albiluteola TaxID=2758564 RepID=A0A7W2YJ66_9GAMM|nr:FAD-dependent oxidoreductase [Sediminihaliea albiluteola]MBA6412309.1 FAD-dependent oxidoreductase [Sediminihaliea albiluteola]